MCLSLRDGPTEMPRDHQMRVTVLLLILTSARAANTQRARSVDHGQPARVGSTLHGDEPLKTVQPILPPEAVSRGIVGPVLLEIRIDESGAVSVLGVVRGHPLLDSPAKGGDSVEVPADGGSVVLSLCVFQESDHQRSNYRPLVRALLMLNARGPE